ncbi:ATP-binding protein [Methanomicrobium antiquum]|uniref:ATP-binding protein n=1 Tax=Methanomicrobium antiquum TaxID=487686 RepID=A0AAF0FXK5_9EURY|nr:ATP-binding protein [Methanomicrobium antiquum]WFN36799.1 ATP-binding protein [Methanomicrobium antiquum]
MQIVIESQNPWWFSKDFDTGINRLSFFPEIMQYLDAKEILLLTGARRTGKSTLAYQLIDYLIKTGTPIQNILYINLDEPLFMSMRDEPLLLGSIVEEYMSRRKNNEIFYLFIDEIQNYNYWAYAIKTFYDTKKDIKCILTGSTSSILKNDAAARLSGRYLTCTIYPLSFQEFLNFKGIINPRMIEKRQLFDEFLKFGGYPRIAVETNDSLKRQILKNYYETIYLKDIILPNNLRNNSDLVNLLYFLISNSGNLYSFNKIAEILNISPDTVKEYTEYAQNCYLLYTLMKYTWSVKKQIANPKKIYALDTGLINAVSFAFSENKGRLLENYVFCFLNRIFDEIYYHKKKYECDFVVKSKYPVNIRENTKLSGNVSQIVLAVQVSLSLKNLDTKNREIRGLKEAMEDYNLDEGYIVTENEKDRISLDGKIIHIIPAYSLEHELREHITGLDL